MCLAKAYVRTTGADMEPGGADVTDGALLLMENVTHVKVDGDRLELRSLLGTTESLRGRIASIDFMDSKLVVDSLEPQSATG